MAKCPYFYLATVYSIYEDGLEAAYKMACEQSAKFLAAGVNVLCPIAHAHGIHKFSQVELPSTHDFWVGFVDRPMLEHSSGVIVITSKNWEKSVGIGLELDYARKHNMPIYFKEPAMPVHKEDYKHAVS